MTSLKIRPKLNKEFEKVCEEGSMLEIPSFTIEELKDLPFTAKAVEQLEQDGLIKAKICYRE